MSLAITTSDALTIAECSTLKRAQPSSSLPSCLPILTRSVASSWSPDSSQLFIASTEGIHRYDPETNQIKDIYASSSSPITHMMYKDRSSLIFTSSNKVHLLDCISNSNVKISKTYESHKTLVNSISLSNDSTLLATTSADAVHVYNLSLGSHTVLRGLAGGGVTTCAFHPHSRTRLLLGVSGKKLVVYDTTRPSGPVKSIALSESSSGEINVVACSPFSKTLVAVSTTAGSVGLIDLDKEKGLFRTLNMKVPLTSMAFSPEGAMLYLGTENGKLLLVDLRALDKPPKSITVSEGGSRVETINVQKKPTKSTNENAKPTAASTVKSTTPATPPPRRKVSVPAQKPGVPAKATRATTPARRTSGTASRPELAMSTPKRAPEKKKVFSPVRDPLGNSMSVDDISVSLGSIQPGLRKTPTKKSPVVTSASTRSGTTSPLNSPTTGREEGKKPRVLSRKPSTASTVAGPSSGSARVRVSSTASASVRPTTTTSASGRLTASRARTLSSASRVSRPGSSASARGGKREASPVPPVPAFPKSVSRSPSPELPDIPIPADYEQLTPAKDKKKSMSVLGLGTPEVNRWIQAGEMEKDKDKGKGKCVGFEDEDEEEEGVEEIKLPKLGKGKDRSLSMAMQISPRRSMPLRSSTTAAPSPLRNQIPSPHGNGGAASTAQDFLRNIVRDIMYDYQQETKAEITGLHLDMVRMGRGWKKELREVMDEYVGDLKDLRDENKKLREENEKLRRGY